MKDISLLLDKLPQVGKQVLRYAVPVFLLLVVAIYGFLVYRVNVLNAVEPSQSDIASKSQTATVPRIDPRVLRQLQSLRDNSTSVQTLFQSTRTSPFQE